MVQVILLLVLMPAVRSDVRERRIPNQVLLFSLILTFSMALVNSIQSGHIDTDFSLTQRLSGLLVGLLCFLPLHIARLMGAGDVKLMAACGAILGPELAWQGALVALMLGGVMALAWKLWFGLPSLLLWHPFGALWRRLQGCSNSGAIPTVEGEPKGFDPLRYTTVKLPFSLPVLLASISITLFQH